MKPASQSQAAFNPGTSVLRWTYASIGDYDQNSEVNVADLSALGANLGTSNAPDPFDHSWMESVIDGDSNGQINIADITPLGANLRASVRRYNVYSSTDPADYDPDPQAVSTLTPIGTVEFAEVQGDKQADRLFFEFTVPAPVADSYYWVRPSDGTTEGTPSTLAGGAPTPITVTLEACQATYAGPYEFRFYVLTDPEDPFWNNSYNWDFDNDGTFDEIDALPDWYSTHSYAAAGDYEVRLQVESPEGGIGEATIPISVLHKAIHSTTFENTVDDPAWGPDTGPSALGIVSGHPAFAARKSPHFNTAFYGEVLFYRANDAAGTSWPEPVTLNEQATTPDSNAFPVLIDADGFPAIVFDGTTGLDQVAVKYVRADDVTGTSWPVETNITDPSGRSHLVAAGTIQGRPAVVYEASDTYFFMLADQPEGTSWGTPVSLGSPAPGDSGFILDAATPLVIISQTFSGGGDPDLLVWRAQDASGLSWDAAQVLSSNHIRAVAEMVAGIPAMAFIGNDANEGELNFVSATDNSGTSWNPAVVVAEHVYQLDLLEADGLPTIAFSTSEPTPFWPGYEKSELFVAQAGDVQGSTWGTPREIGCAGVPPSIYQGISAIALPGSELGVYSYPFHVFSHPVGTFIAGDLL